MIIGGCDPQDTSFDSTSFAETSIALKKALNTLTEDPIIDDYYYIIFCGKFYKIVQDATDKYPLIPPEGFFHCKFINICQYSVLLTSSFNYQLSVFPRMKWKTTTFSCRGR
jgi:hypothetical protein